MCFFLRFFPYRRLWMTSVAVCAALAALDPAFAQDAAAQPTECEKLAAPAPAFATPAQIKAAAHADWPRALVACQIAEQSSPNDPRVQFLLGRGYDKMKVYAEAARHYQIAAAANYAPAENALGLLFVLGRGVVRDHQQAFMLFNKAALAGDGEAMGNLGSMFANAYFVKQDNAKALEWYEKAIEAGNAFGLAQAGVMYFNGQGTPRDYQAAAEYFQQAADLGDGYSLKFLALMYERGLIGAPDPAKAAELRRKAAEVDPDSPNPNVPPPSTAGASHRSSGGRLVRIRRYRFNGCNWMWC
jgi:uncharacterized protein